MRAMAVDVHSEWLLAQRSEEFRRWHVERERRNVQFEPIVTKDLVARVGGVVKMVGVSDDPATMEACENDVREGFGDVVSVARSQTYYLDVTHPEANKGEVLRRFSRELDGHLADVERASGRVIVHRPADHHGPELGGLRWAWGRRSVIHRRRAYRLVGGGGFEPP